MPRLLVAIPTYQDSLRLRDCVRTLYAYAPGDYRVVISCQSQDERMKAEVGYLVEEYKDEDLQAVFWETNEHGDVDRHLNEILLGSSEEYVAWTHDDTLFVPSGRDFWEELMDVAADEHVGVVGPCSNSAEALQDVRRCNAPERVVCGNVHVPTVLFRREFLEEMEGLADLACGTGIMDLCVRSIKSGRVNVVNRRVYVHHGGGSTYETKFDGYRDLVEWLKELAEVAANEIIRRNGLAWFVRMLEIDATQETVEWLCGEQGVAAVLEYKAKHRYVPYEPEGDSICL